MTISGVIPCFNDGEFLSDAVNSVLVCSYPDLELIIVNDGSTDPFTLDVLSKYERDGIKIISHTNKGLAYTRNMGIKHSKGEYILLLDADNKVKKAYITQAVKLLQNDKCDIVYSKPTFFGEDLPLRKFKTFDFDGELLFLTNYIDACAIFRRTVWESVNGFDEKMPFQGTEDWEFWISCHIKGFRFKFLNEELFEYRIKATSMISQINPEQSAVTKNYIITKHLDEYRAYNDRLGVIRLFYLNDQKNYLRTSVKYLVKYFKNIIKK